MVIIIIINEERDGVTCKHYVVCAVFIYFYKQIISNVMFVVYITTFHTYVLITQDDSITLFAHKT